MSSLGTDDKDHMGVKSIVSIASILNIPECIPIDYMHLVLLGMFRKLGDIYFKKMISKSISRVQMQINECKMPLSVTRKTFNLEKISNWKATEYKNFFFYLAIPLLHDILPKKYLFNLYCLVSGD